MPERSLTVATYAAGASLAAITLIYVFAPTYLIDSDNSTSSAGVFGSRKKGIVGLSNPANDCFINSVLQALAGLHDLRLYLIQETHRRSLEDEWVYMQIAPDDAGRSGERLGSQPRKPQPEWKTEGLQMGIVTRGLKEMLDALNERPIYKKTISAGPFIRTLEVAFRQRISRQQQDAQEFLQVVAERLCDEYHAGCRARKFARERANAGSAGPQTPNQGSTETPAESATTAKASSSEGAEDKEVDGGFPLEGKFESQIECLTCGFKPRPTESTFCSLTLNVPQVSSTSLGACFDGMFKTEYIDDFKCEKCRLVHAVEVLQTHLATASDASRQDIGAAIAKLKVAIDADPENPPRDVALPDLRHAPKRRIARHIRLTLFPRVLAIHLSRSIFDASNLSQKNYAKVSFPEKLPLGGLLQQKKYKLRGLVTHKGSHHSGHYETFRRQDLSPPFSNPSTFQPSEVYSKTVSASSTPRVQPSEQKSSESSPLTSVPDLTGPSSGLDSPTASPGSNQVPQNIDIPLQESLAAGKQAHLTKPQQNEETDAGSVRSAAASARGPFSRNGNAVGGGGVELKPTKPRPVTETKRRKPQDKWWRISDEKVKLASTSDVLGMQKEVYLLFYEIERKAISICR